MNVQNRDLTNRVQGNNFQKSFFCLSRDFLSNFLVFESSSPNIYLIDRFLVPRPNLESEFDWAAIVEMYLGKLKEDLNKFTGRVFWTG